MWSKSVVVHPWVGDRYDAPRHLKYRTLVLGESNFTSPNIFGASLVKDCVADDMSTDPAIERDSGGFCRFSTKIRRVVFGADETLGPQGFWPDVAFYNFVQTLVGDKPRMRPTDVMWSAGVPAFIEIVSQLKPQRVLVLGKATWGNLTKSVQHETVDSHSALLKVAGDEVLAGYVNHPSSSLRYAEWQPVARELLLQ